MAQLELRLKSDASEHIEALCTRLQNEKSLKIDWIRSDHGKEFKNLYMESIRILLALACHLKFKLYQMDVKTTFLNRFLKEDVYVAQPKGFIDHTFWIMCCTLRRHSMD